MDATSPLLRAKNRHHRVAALHALVDRADRVEPREMVRMLLVGVGEMLELEERTEQERRVAVGEAGQAREELAVKDQLVEKYRQQLMEAQQTQMALENQCKQQSNEIKTLKAQLAQRE